MTPANSVSDQPTTDFGLAEGIALAQKEEEASQRSPLVDWFARNPQHARGVAEYLSGSHEVRRSVAPQSESGSAIGGFELREEIGRGGMGVVYRAYDPNLKRDVAVKRMRADAMGSEGDWAGFQFEAEAVASLDHENIVRVHAYGVEGGSPYLVMPLMEGGSLAQRLRLLGPDRCLSPKKAAELIRKIALGVHHAHQRGLLHRDLKPGNILFDVNSQPHIADFGLARRLDASHSQSASGSIAGTAAYMAPEQARGEKGLTVAVDIHALGAILYELLTGEPPFGMGELIPTLKRVLEDEATSVRKRRPEVSADLEAICMKCLEKRTGDRYRSAGELAEDLDHFVNGEAVLAQPPGFWDWVRQLARTQPEPHLAYTWQVTAWFGFLFLATQCATYALVQADGASIWVWVAHVANASAMSLVLWWYMLRRFRALPVTERHSLIIAVGAILSFLALTVALVPLSFTASAREALAIYPGLLAVSGMGVFVVGSTHWSRFFPLGIALILLTPVMAWWPESAPLVYGALIASVMWYWSYSQCHMWAAKSG